MLLLIDNYDSFTHNLARYFAELGQDVKVVRNDDISLQGIEAMQPDHLVFSPGPCTPNEAGISLRAIERFAGQIPMLGVCLGHQAIGQVFGAKVSRARHIMHGKTSRLKHDNSEMYRDVPDPFTATRYHSLILESDSVPAEFAVNAWCDEFDEIEVMGFAHHTMPIYGVQYHPESVLTDYGHQILQNFIRLGHQWSGQTSDALSTPVRALN